MNKINCFLFLIILFTMNGMSKKTEDIVFSEGNTLFFCDYNGTVKNKIQLPYELKDFKLKGRNICFVDTNERIRLLNIDDMREENILEGPYFYKKKMMLNKIKVETGQELLRDIDFSIEKRWIVCVCRPDFAINTYEDGVTKKWINEDYDEFSNAILIDYGNGKVNTDMAHNEEGYYGHCKMPLIYKNSIIFNSGPALIYLDLENNFELDFEKSFIKYYQLKADGEPLYNLNKIKDELVIIRIAELEEGSKWENAYEEIYSYDFVKKSFKKIRELKYFRKIGDPYNRILDISSNYGHILVNDGNDMYLVDLKDLKKKLIHKFEKILYKAQFYCK